MTLLTLRRAAHASPVAISMLVLANLVPLAGVLLLGWDLATLVALYWLENGVIGVFAVLRIATAEGSELVPGMDQLPPGAVPAVLQSAALARLIVVPFFIAHYGLFWLVHGVFVWAALPSLFRSAGAPGGGPSLGAIAWAVPFLVLSHGASFLYNWWWGGERRTSSPAREMRAPYSRVLVLHLTIVIGAFAVAFLGAPVWALVVMVAVKTLADLAGHLGERERAERRAGASTTAWSAGPADAA